MGLYTGRITKNLEATRVTAAELAGGGRGKCSEDYVREKKIIDSTSKNTMGITLPERPGTIF